MPLNFVTLVSGLPRAGTSLMMQMLAAGGMEVMTDGRRAADQHNPRGYFELEAVKYARTDCSWLAGAEGKAVKVVHLLLPHLPAEREYRVIFMLRDLTEIIASQRTMLQQQGRPTSNLPDAKLAEIFGNQLSEVGQWLSRHPNFRVLHLQHREVLESPLTAAQQVALFLGGGLEINRMAVVVEPGLYRQRHESPRWDLAGASAVSHELRPGGNIMVHSPVREAVRESLQNKDFGGGEA